MYKTQSNSARFIYTLSPIKSKRQTENVLLNNGYYFNKEPRSDEKLLYREQDIKNIVTTAMQIILFKISPNESMYDIINTGKMSLNSPELLCIYETIGIHDFVHIIDTLFGEGFCRVASRPILQVYQIYRTQWQYYDVGEQMYVPSANDFIQLYRFMNTANPTYSSVTRFILCNANDAKPNSFTTVVLQTK